MANSRHGRRPAIRQKIKDEGELQEMREQEAEHSQRREVKVRETPASPGFLSFMAQPATADEASVAN